MFTTPLQHMYNNLPQVTAPYETVMAPLHQRATLCGTLRQFATPLRGCLTRLCHALRHLYDTLDTVGQVTTRCDSFTTTYEMLPHRTTPLRNVLDTLQKLYNTVATPLRQLTTLCDTLRNSYSTSAAAYDVLRHLTTKRDTCTALSYEPSSRLKTPLPHLTKL